MIVYDKLWPLMKEKNISQYRLTVLGISHSTLTRLKKNQPVSVETIGKLCEILDCNVGDIMEYKKDDQVFYGMTMDMLLVYFGRY